MEEILGIDDVCKEVITILAYFNNELMQKIPSKVLKKISELASYSNYNVSIDTEKQLKEQSISEKSKDLIALLYYRYIADENEKNELKKIWEKNEKIFQKELKEKYNLDNIFKKTDKQECTNLETAHNNSNTDLNEYKQCFFIKFKNLLFRIKDYMVRRK